MDDPLLVEVQSEDFWYEGYNMRTGARGIFPAYYAVEVTRDPESYAGTISAPPPHLSLRLLPLTLPLVSPAARSGEWSDRHRLKFLGSVQVPLHKGNDVLCAAMQKVGSRSSLQRGGGERRLGSTRGASQDVRMTSRWRSEPHLVSSLEFSAQI